MPTVDDSYSEANQDDWDNLYSGSLIRAGQSFTSQGGELDSVKFYLRKTGTPTGNATATIYAHSGTYGTSSVGTGSALATSATFDVSTLTTSFQLITFAYSGAQRITLTAATKYVVTLEYSGGDVSNYVRIGRDASSPTHGGNYTYYDSSWHYNVAPDTIFYVYTASSAGTYSDAGSTTKWSNDPTFVSATDWHLQITSNLVNYGTDLGYTTDIVGTAVPTGSAPEVGCYEYYSTVSIIKKIIHNINQKRKGGRFY